MLDIRVDSDGGVESDGAGDVLVDAGHTIGDDIIPITKGFKEFFGNRNVVEIL